MRSVIALLAVVFLIAGCSGDSGDETASTGSGDPTNTTGGAPETTEGDDDGQTVNPGDIPQECIDAFVEFLQAIEPIVDDIDWDSATLEEFTQVGEEIDTATGDFDTPSGCDDLDVDANGEESYEYILDIARDRAPGTVDYFEFLFNFSGGVDGPGTGGGDGVQATGDCETDIAAFQAIIDQGGTIEDMTLNELAAVGNLSSSVGINCPPERSSEFFSQEDVIAFLGS